MFLPNIFPAQKMVNATGSFFSEAHVAQTPTREGLEPEETLWEIANAGPGSIYHQPGDVKTPSHHSEIRIGLKIRVGKDAKLKNHMHMFPSVLMSRSILR